MIEVSTIKVAGKEYQVKYEEPLDISLPLREGKNNPNCYYAEDPVFETIRMGNFVGSVEEGGPVNYQRVTITPHGNGTHTESYRHLSKDPAKTVNNSLKKFIFICGLVTISPEKTGDGDLVISKDALLPLVTKGEFEALVIRTLPNDTSKKIREYSGTNPPYFTSEAIAYLAEAGICHILVDLPSIDKEEDGGKLEGHRAFWFPGGRLRENCTITELVYVPEIIPDGLYLLNLQICSLETDAAPSKPVLYYLYKK